MSEIVPNFACFSPIKFFSGRPWIFGLALSNSAYYWSSCEISCQSVGAWRSHVEIKKTSAVKHKSALKAIASGWYTYWLMIRDQLNSRFHGRDIFREIDLLPWKTPISVKSVNFSAFSLIYDNSRVLSAAFVWMLLFATCRTSALSSWHWLSWVLT